MATNRKVLKGVSIKAKAKKAVSVPKDKVRALESKLKEVEKELEKKSQKIINKHELITGTWICKWCGKDHPGFDTPCVDRYEDGTIVK